MNLPTANNPQDAEYQRKIAYGQSWNLAVAAFGPASHIFSDGKQYREELKKWQEWFYEELTKPYTSKSYNLGQVDKKKSKDIGQEDLGLDTSEMN